MKTPTHQMKDGHGPVRAWQNLPSAPVPAWVFRNFHHLGNKTGVLTALTGKRLVTVKPTEWIVDAGGVATVLTAQEFSDLFTPLP